MTERRGVRRRRRIGAATVVVLLAGLWLVGLARFATMLPRAPADTDVATDVVVVLTGGSERLREALSLLAADRETRLFVSGVHRGVEVSEILRLHEEDRSGMTDRIVLGHDAEDTRGNARETAAWIAHRGYGSLRLVTANYHMPRSLIEFRAAMPGVRIVPHPVSPPTVRLDRWWRWPGSARLLAIEYAKYLFAWARWQVESAVRAVTAT